MMDKVIKLGEDVRMLPMFASVAYGSVRVEVIYEANLLEIEFATGS